MVVSVGVIVVFFMVSAEVVVENLSTSSQYICHLAPTASTENLFFVGSSLCCRLYL